MDRTLFMRAKEVPLESFVAWERRSTRRFPSGLRMEGCFAPSCASGDLHRTSIRNGYFRCWECGAAGDVVKAASLAWRKTQADAARALLSRQAQIAAVNVSRYAGSAVTNDEVAVQALRQVCEALFAARWFDAAAREALVSRCIAPAVIDEALEQGLLVGLPPDPVRALEGMERIVGSGLLRQAGLWQSGAGVPACAYRPLWYRHGTESFEARSIPGIEVRGAAVLRYGTAVKPFQLVATDPAQAAHVCKSPLDAMSLRALGVQGRVIGLPGEASWRRADESGLPNPDWFADLRNARIAYPGTMDGVKRAQALMKHLVNAGIEASVMDMPEGCDVNDMLIGVLML